MKSNESKQDSTRCWSMAVYGSQLMTKRVEKSKSEARRLVIREKGKKGGGRREKDEEQRKIEEEERMHTCRDDHRMGVRLQLWRHKNSRHVVERVKNDALPQSTSCNET